MKKNLIVHSSLDLESKSLLSSRIKTIYLLTVSKDCKMIKSMLFIFDKIVLIGF